MLRRIEIRELPIICEWDEGTGEAMVGIGGGRSVAFDRFNALTSAVDRSGYAYITDEFRERRATDPAICGMQEPVVLVWKVTFYQYDRSRVVAQCIAAAAGVVMETLELEVGE